MIEFLRGWTTNLVIFIIIISFLEMILPTGNIKRFVKVTIGLIIILVIINPFIKLVQGDIDIEKEVFKNIENQYKYREGDYREFELSQDNTIEQMYVEEIKKEIEDKIIKKTDYIVVKSNIEIDKNKDGSNYGALEEISLILEDDKEDQSKESSELNEIKSIKVDVKIANISDKNNLIEEKIYINNKDIENIEDQISTQFEIPKERVSIDLKTKD